MEQEQQVAELLKPRYKVIADWPGNTKYEVGQILNGYSPGYGGGELIRNDKGESVWLSPEKYPDNFKELSWWEERKESDMPEYVKWKECVHKVTYKLIGGILNFQSEGEKIFQSVSFAAYRGILPATKEEYENQNKK